MISVTALMPDGFTAVSPATKAFVLAFTEALVVEQGPKGVQVQAVLPGITRTPIWTEEQMAGLPPEMVMEVDDMVDAALKGLDRRDDHDPSAARQCGPRHRSRCPPGAAPQPFAPPARRSLRRLTPASVEPDANP
jgi:NAD(P)-dependent dehydrogenase (short-subunit alcohol dehydrogenase family)